MNNIRAEEVARAVAGVLHISEEYTPHHWDKTKGSTLWRAPDRAAVDGRMVWVAHLDGYWCSAEEVLSDMNVARRLFEWAVKGPLSGGKHKDAVFGFAYDGWFKTPAAIEALCIAAGLVPEEKDQ